VRKNNAILIPKRDAIVNVGWLMLSHPALSPDHLPSDYHLLGPLKNASEDIMTQRWGIAACCACVATEEGAQLFFFGWEHMFLFEGGKENGDKVGDCLEN
jgi:hypothetical protein